MHKIIATKKIKNGFILDEFDIKHLKVLRIKENSDFFIVNYNFEFYKCLLFKNIAKIIEKLDINNEYDGNLTLLMSIIKPKNFELVVQKATELGCKNLIPIITNRTQRKYLEKFNLQRLLKITKQAAEQSFRNKQLNIEKPFFLKDINNLKLSNFKYFAHEKSNFETSQFFNSNSCFLIGPEGGFDNQEICFLEKNNWIKINLGKTILRSETAAIKVLSRVLS